MHELNPCAFELARPAFQTLNNHLAVDAVLAGRAAGRVFADIADGPHTALAWINHRLYLAGSPGNDAFNATLARLFDEVIYPHGIASGQSQFLLTFAPDGWGSRILHILRDKNPIPGLRQYYACATPRPDGHAALPGGFSLRAVDSDLLSNNRLTNLDELKSEMCSERPSVEDFLARSFGVCLLHEDELAGWCLSEYNNADSCEVGIETVSSYRRRGLATVMASALVEEASSRGITYIGWHCWASNVASGATAVKAGFEKVEDYPVFILRTSG